MKQISSHHNVIFKDLKALAKHAKVRREQNKTILEGIHLSDSYLKNGKKPLSCVVSDSALINPEVIVIVEECERQNIPLVQLSDSQFSSLSTLDNGIGILLEIEQPASQPAGTLDGPALLLDGIQDPGNLGTILRTAAAAGITAVYCSSATANVWAPKVLRAGMGAHFTLEIYESVDLAALLKTAQVIVCATTLQAKQTIYETDLRGAAWIIGNEGQGISSELLTQDVKQVIIPQNSDVESLNAAAATAVCLFEQRRQTISTQSIL